MLVLTIEPCTQETERNTTIGSVKSTHKQGTVALRERERRPYIEPVRPAVGVDAGNNRPGRRQPAAPQGPTRPSDAVFVLEIRSRAVQSFQRERGRAAEPAISMETLSSSLTTRRLEGSGEGRRGRRWER